MKFKILILAILQLICIKQLNAQFKYTPEIVELMDYQWKLIDVTRPLFVNANNVRGDAGANVTYGCLIFPFSPYIKSGYAFFDSVKNKRNDNTGAYIFNDPIRDIFAVLYGRPGFTQNIATHFSDTTRFFYRYPERLANSQIELRNVDTTKLVGSVNGTWIPENGWNIQIASIAELPEAKVRKQMIGAMEMQFGLDTFIEKQKKKCLVLSRNEVPIVSYKQGIFWTYLGTEKATKKGIAKFNDVPMVEIVHSIDRAFLKMPYPIVDETRFTEHLGKIEFTTDGPLNLADLTNQMAQYGIKISIEERLVDVLVITKAK